MVRYFIKEVDTRLSPWDVSAQIHWEFVTLINLDKKIFAVFLEEQDEED